MNDDQKFWIESAVIFIITLIGILSIIYLIATVST
jgi:hypothetical protein